MKTGDTAFIIESNRLIREVEIIRTAGEFYLICFKDSGGGIKVRKNRLFPTREEAEGSFLQSSQKKHRALYDYMQIASDEVKNESIC